VLKISGADATFKICIFGEGGVGKTCLAQRFLTGLFDINTKMTMGASLHVKSLDIADLRVSLQIWDFGGEKDYRFLLPAYALGSSAGIFMYDMSRSSTIHKVEDWLNIFQVGLKKDISEVPLFLVGGKMDLEEKRSVDISLAQSISEQYNFKKIFETSAKTGENVELLFKRVTEFLLKKSELI
jgi:small GTP-binding protein